LGELNLARPNGELKKRGARSVSKIPKNIGEKKKSITLTQTKVTNKDGKARPEGALYT